MFDHKNIDPSEVDTVTTPQDEGDITSQVVAYQNGEPGANDRICNTFEAILEFLVAYFMRTSSDSVRSNDIEDFFSEGLVVLLEKAMGADASEKQYLGSYVMRARGQMKDYRRGEYTHGMKGKMAKGDYPTWETLPDDAVIYCPRDATYLVDLQDLIEHVAKDEKDLRVMTCHLNGEKSSLPERTERDRLKKFKERLKDELYAIEGLAAPTLAT